MQSIIWSTETVLVANVARAQSLGLSVAPIDLLPCLRDIDTAEVSAHCGMQLHCWGAVDMGMGDEPSACGLRRISKSG